jgi:hypothetical protein
MNNQVVSHEKGVFSQYIRGYLQAQGSMGAAFDAEGFSLLLHPVEAEIAGVNQKGNVFRIDGSIRTGVGTGLAADAAHVVPHQDLVFLRLLLQSVYGTGVDAVRLLALSAHQGVGSQFDHGHNPVVARMIEIAAGNVAVLALPGGTDIQIDQQPDIIPFRGFGIQFPVMDLFGAIRHNPLLNPRYWDTR